MRVVGYVLLAVLGVLVLLLLAAVIRTLCMKKKTSDYTPHPDAAREREYAEKLSRMVAYETVSHPDDPELEKPGTRMKSALIRTSGQSAIFMFFR